MKLVYYLSFMMVSSIIVATFKNIMSISYFMGDGHSWTALWVNGSASDCAWAIVETITQDAGIIFLFEAMIVVFIIALRTKYIH